MGYLAFFASFVLFLLVALTGTLDFESLYDNTGDFTAWGFVFLALGHFLGGGVTYFRNKVH